MIIPIAMALDLTKEALAGVPDSGSFGPTAWRLEHDADIFWHPEHLKCSLTDHKAEHQKNVSEKIEDVSTGVLE